MEFFTDIDKEKLIEFYEYFEGLKEGNQRRKLGEENQELVEELLLLFDNGIGDIKHIIEEIADNIILIYEHVYALDITQDELVDAIREKMQRTEFRKLTKYYEQ